MLSAFLTQAIVDWLGVIIVSILADLVKMLQVWVCVEFGHFLDGGQLGFHSAAEKEQQNNNNNTALKGQAASTLCKQINNKGK